MGDYLEMAITTEEAKKLPTAELTDRLPALFLSIYAR